MTIVPYNHTCIPSPSPSPLSATKLVGQVFALRTWSFNGTTVSRLSCPKYYHAYKRPPFARVLVEGNSINKFEHVSFELYVRHAFSGHCRIPDVLASYG